MNIIKAYYDHILDIFMEVYGESIQTAQPGNCMKVTGFSMDVLRDLYGRLCLLDTKTQFYILTEDEDLIIENALCKLSILNNTQPIITIINTYI